jgi:hypothetical protein
MKNLEALKSRSQENLAHLVDVGKQQSQQAKQWGVTAAATVAGALVMPAVAKGMLGVVALLTYPPVALTAGALGGGFFGWSFMQRRAQAQTKGNQEAVAPEAAGLDVPFSSAASTVSAEPT